MRVAVLLLPSLLYGVNCAHPENTAEKTLCAQPELKSQSQEIDRRTTELKRKIGPEYATMLADTEMPFLRTRNNCANETDVPECLKKVLKAREDLLSRVEAQPDAIRQAIAEARYIDIAFLHKYWRQLVDRKVFVFGCLSPGDDPSKTHAELEMEHQPPAPLVFKSMPEETAEFLDDQKPCGQWLVTIRRRGDNFLLFADEVLGQPLP